MRGGDVRAWQEACGATADGIFGPLTEERTKKWQATRGLAADGVVGPRTKAAIDGPILVTPDTEPPDTLPDLEPIAELPKPRLIPAKHSRHRWLPDGASINRVILHSAETPERPGTAEGLGAYFKDPMRPGRDGGVYPVSASVHYSVDSDSIVQHLAEDRCAYHVRARGVNDRSIGIEQAGRAKQTRAEWLDPYGRAMLPIVAKLVRDVCSRHGIPIQRPTVEEIRDGAPGIMGHRDIRDAYKQDTHWDPGRNYPWDVLLELVERS